MRKWVKVLFSLLVSFLIIFLIGGFIFYRMLIASLPNYDGKVTTAHIQNQVKIYTDSMAIPYILAQNPEDAAFALGYLHARERMFQMDLVRRAGEGRLSEIFGTRTIAYDEMFRTVGIARTAEKIVEKLDPLSLKILQAYSNGVNLYIKKAKGHYPIEFDILGYTPELWKPVHSIITIRMMAWDLNISWWADLSFSELVQKFGEQKAMEIIPDFPEDAPHIIESNLKKIPKIRTSLIEIDKSFRNFMNWGGTHIGSNNWVIDGKLSASGKPIIANDPHLSYSAPGRWYAAVIRSNGLNVEGVTLPGMPGVVIGKNQDIAWVLTNIMEDEADFYSEKLDSSKTKYFYNNKWEKLQVINDTIKVKDSSSVPIKIRITDHGPIISNIHPFSFVYNDKAIDSSAISMKWLGNEISNEMLAMYKVNTAKDWNEFKEGVSYFTTPGQNFVYADKYGNIGYLYGGKLPIRPGNSMTFVADGTTNKYNWKGYVPQSELPSLFNPPQDFIATANNKTEKNFKYYISNLWEPPSRIERIDELLTQKKNYSVHDFKDFQMDFVSPYARELTPYILNAFDGFEITDQNLQTAINLFKDWDFDMSQYSQVPAIYSVFFKHLLKNIYEDEMGEKLFNEFIFLQNVPLRSVMKLMKEPSSSWFDDVNTKEIETRDVIIRKSLSEALTELENKFGKNIAGWQWGKLHKAVFKHPFSGYSSLIDKYIDIGPFSIGGDGTTIFNTEYSFAKSSSKYSEFSHKEFENLLGPSMRFIFDFSKPDRFYLILTTGESGNVLSDYYRDMAHMWLTGKYLTIRTDVKSITNPKNHLLELIPSASLKNH